MNAGQRNSLILSHQAISLVDPIRENWKTIFSDLQLLCERLELLDIEAIMEAENV